MNSIMACRVALSFVRKLGLTAIGLVLVEFSVGVASVLTELPIILAVAHNWLAAILMLVLLKMLALNR